MQQGSEDWFNARRGKVTASKVADVIAKTKTGWGASRANYMAQLIVERLTDVTPESYTNSAMQWGIDTEPKARAAYAFLTGHETKEVGFIQHPTIKMAGASPDGFVDSEGLIEIKCPNTSTHIETLLGSPIEKKYITQMQFQMACAGKKWCDFVSFDPRLPIDLQLKVDRVERDDALISSLEKDIVDFLNELDKKMEALERLKENV